MEPFLGRVHTPVAGKVPIDLNPRHLSCGAGVSARRGESIPEATGAGLDPSATALASSSEPSDPELAQDLRANLRNCAPAVSLEEEHP